MGEQIAKVILALSGLVWPALACYVVFLLRDHIKESVARLSNVEAFGLKVTMTNAQSAMIAAVDLAKKNPNWPVEVPETDGRRAIERAQKERGQLFGTEILWVDDHPRNNRNEARMFQTLGAFVTFATSAEEALCALREAATQMRPFQLVLSDMSRGGPTPDAAAGLKMLTCLRTKHVALPVIFYVGQLDQEKGVPPGAFGITNRPDQLLHLVLDAMERVRGRG